MRRPEWGEDWDKYIIKRSKFSKRWVVGIPGHLPSRRFDSFDKAVQHMIQHQRERYGDRRDH